MLYEVITNPECKPVRMLVSGVAGTGKSFLIEALSVAMDEIYAPKDKNGKPIDSTVLRMAPTGVFV